MQKTLSDYKTEERRSVPKYELLKRLLLDLITELPPEQEFLPFEEEIAKRFDVCRSTVTKAMAKLRRDGYIETARRRGSRILKRTVDAHRPILRRSGMNDTVGFLLSNDRESNERIEENRWTLVDETERIFARHGIRLVVYNLRENHWQGWSDPSVLLNSLRANGIQWIILRASQNLSYPWQENLAFLQKNGIRIVFTFQDMTDSTLFADYFGMGMDYSVVNCHNSMVHALESCGNMDALFFVANASCLFFSESRKEVCRRFAVRKRIPFFFYVGEFYRETDSEKEDWTCYVDDLLCKRFSGELLRYRNPYCFGANDMHIYALLKHLKKRGTDYSHCTFIGHDNFMISKEYGFSTFDFSYAERAEALFSLYTDFLGNPNSMECRGITTFSRFIDRRERK